MGIFQPTKVSLAEGFYRGAAAGGRHPVAHRWGSPWKKRPFEGVLYGIWMNGGSSFMIFHLWFMLV